MHSNRRGIEAVELAFGLSLVIVFLIALLQPPSETKSGINVSTHLKIETKTEEGNEKMIKKADAIYVAVFCIIATKLTEKEWDDLLFLKLDDDTGYQFKLANKSINLYYDKHNHDFFVKHEENYHFFSKTDRYETSAAYIAKYLKEN